MYARAFDLDSARQLTHSYTPPNGYRRTMKATPCFDRSIRSDASTRER